MKRILFLLVIWMSTIGILHAVEVKDTVPLTQMNPLVGSGCVISQIDKNLVEVIAGTSDLDYILDTNLNNYANFRSVAGVTLLYNPILSVKDMNRVFTPGTASSSTAGFIIQSAQGGTNLLTADVLEMFWIETYLNGELQEASNGSSSTTTGLLDLNLITVSSDGKTKVSIPVTKAFDEIRIGVAGVNVDVLSNLRLYCAYAGENPIVPITVDNYSSASVHASTIPGIGNEWTTAIWNWPNAKNNLVGSNSENNGVGFGTLTNLLTEPRVTINAGTAIPAGTEVGFVIESGSVLAINLLQNTVLTTYDANNNEKESKTIVSVLGLSAIGGGRTSVSMVTTQPCQQVKIKFGGVNIDLGGTKIFYAYTRSTEANVPTECNLGINADITICSGNQVPLVGVSGIQWSIAEKPAGTLPTVNAGGLVEGLTTAGEYVIKAMLGECVDYVTINKRPTSTIDYSCNRPIVGDNVTPFSPVGGGCLLCIATGTGENIGNVIDNDLNNYVEYTQGLDLAANTSVFGVDAGKKYEDVSAATPLRVGFVMQATNQFLNLNLLKFFVIKTYLDGVEQESSLVNENNAIAADLVGGMDNLVRYSFEATKPFNQVALWTAGLLNLNISKFRIYYAFEEPVNANCMTGNNASACVSILSQTEFGAKIAYEHTGFGGLANVGAFMTNLDRMIDTDIDSYALINKVAGVGGSATLSVKTNRIITSGYQAGFIIQDQTWVTNADLLSAVRIKTYLNGVQTGDEFGTPAVLSLDLIGSGGKSYLTVTPTQPFDEIQLDLSGILDAAINTQVYGAFIRKDSDGDGTPDCIDKNICGDELIPEVSATCMTDSVRVSISGGKDDADYTVWTGTNEYPLNDRHVSFMSPAGKFSYTIRENGTDLYTGIPVLVHDTITTWKGTMSTDWNDWDNWSNGFPWGCTNVIIPSKEKLDNTNGCNYPILTEGGTYLCNYIHFEPGSEVVRNDLLEYSKAWAELKVESKRQYMVSIPLQETYAGDIFIGWGNDSTEIANYDQRPLFTSLSGNVRRINPAITSRSWNGRWGTDALGKILSSGFTMIVDNGNEFPDSTSFVFRFGKEDLDYLHYSIDGQPTGEISSIDRDMANVGKFRFDKTNLEQDERFPYKDTLNINTGKVFVVGNPFIAHLNVGKLIQSINKEGNVVQPFVKVYNNDPNNPNVLYTKPLITLNASDQNATIAPFEAFFVEAVSTTTKQLIIEFTPDMMEHGLYSEEENQDSTPQTRSSIQGESHSQLQLSSLKAYTRNGEGIIESVEKVTKLQVFTVSGKLILEKQNVVAPVRVPLSDGVNLIKVQTENETKTFKLIK